MPVGSRGRRSALLFITATVAVIAARSVHLSGLVDACRDAGGRYVRAPARCEVAGGTARALTALPRQPGWWRPVAGSALVAGALAYGVGRALLARTSRA